MKCPKCGAESRGQFCTNCGTPLGDQQNNYGNGRPQQQARRSGGEGRQQAPRQDWQQPASVPPEYKPITMWGYFGYELLFSIPCVGLILLLIFSFGGTQNVNLRNFARSYFCFLIVMVVLFVALSSLIGIGSLAAFS